MKKVVLILVVALTIFSLTIPANATSYYGNSISGKIYDIYGKLTVSINLKDYVSLTVTLPKVEKYQEFFGFHDSGYFYDLLLMTAFSSDYGSYIEPPTWQQNGSTFVVDLSNLVSDINYTLSQYVDINSSPTKSPYITGKVSSNASSISGKLALGWAVSAYVEELGGTVNGTILITMTYKGYPSTYWHWASAKAKSTSLKGSIKRALEQALSTLPKKVGNSKTKTK
ncbi:MAG: hypothetical protein HXY52_00985 [Nitrospirae bacterium]|nr:hypothetical protein [Nitrospirota bacterium]